ncbi:MAG: hypothetical protein GY761_07555 [Hyphomicrobiales bacterium]|nr:hypothetical protein [Hyphomicrobiales bacterium]
MFRTRDFIFVGLVLLVATATYVLKYGSEIDHNNMAHLEREIQARKGAIDILKANWSLLTNPARIQELSERYEKELQLNTLKPKQIISIEDIPLRKKVAPEVRNAEATGKDEGLSEVITGSIKKESAQR